MPRESIKRLRQLAALLTLVFLATSLVGQAKRPLVYVAPIEGLIDLGLAPFIQRVLDEAVQAGAVAVVLDINTFGGRVDAAVQIRDALRPGRPGPVPAATGRHRSDRRQACRWGVRRRAHRRRAVHRSDPCGRQPRCRAPDIQHQQRGMTHE